MKEEKTRFTVGFYIRQERLQKKMTVEQLAKKVGVSKGTISKWENGYIKNMGIDKAEILANVLGIDLIDIFMSPIYDDKSIEEEQKLNDKICSILINNNKKREHISISEAKKEIEKLVNMSDMTEQQKAMVMTPLNYISSEDDKK